MKVVNTVLFLCTLAYLEVKAGGSSAVGIMKYRGGNFTWGHLKKNDRLLYQTSARHHGNFFRWKTHPSLRMPLRRYGYFPKDTYDVTLPPGSFPSMGSTISYIEGINKSGGAGSVQIIRGGINYEYVTLHLEADYWQTIEFDIKVYGCYRGDC